MQDQESNSQSESPLTEPVRLKLMDVALKFSRNEVDFLQRYAWLHKQAVALKTGAFRWDQVIQSFYESVWHTEADSYFEPWDQPHPCHWKSPAQPGTPMPEKTANNMGSVLEQETQPGNTDELDKQTNHTKSAHQ